MAFVGTAEAPVNTDDVDGASIQVGYQAMLDDAAFLDTDKLSKSLGGAVAGNTTLSAVVSLTITGPMSRSGTGATSAERVVNLDPTNTADTIGAMADLHFLDTQINSGDNAYTLKSTSPAPPWGSRARLTALSLDAGINVKVLRESASEIIKFTGASGPKHFWADFEFIKPDGGGATWRLVAWGGTGTITITTP